MLQLTLAMRQANKTYTKQIKLTLKLINVNSLFLEVCLFKTNLAQIHFNKRETDAW